MRRTWRITLFRAAPLLGAPLLIAPSLRGPAEGAGMSGAREGAGAGR